jgi:hypothetical protein
MSSPQTFITTERQSQSAFFARTLSPEVIHEASPYRLKPNEMLLNLAPSIRTLAASSFGGAGKIVWHQHAAHGLSSQACCLNFLMPLATQPNLLARVMGAALGLDDLTVLPFEPDGKGQPSYIEFEWIGAQNYLDEWPAEGRASRGANATSSDAAVRFRSGGIVQTVLIEWKYTETYGAPLKVEGNPTRTARYEDKIFAPDGPIRSDLGLELTDFFWEPLYQLLRQQMLAWRMEKAGENGAQRVSVLHISPTANQPLHKVTSPKLRGRGDDVFEVFASVLVKPETFVPRTTEEVFRPFLNMDHADPAATEWAGYLRDRYTFLEPVRA